MYIVKAIRIKEKLEELRKSREENRRRKEEEEKNCMKFLEGLGPH